MPTLFDTALAEHAASDIGRRSHDPGHGARRRRPRQVVHVLRHSPRNLHLEVLAFDVVTSRHAAALPHTKLRGARQAGTVPENRLQLFRVALRKPDRLGASADERHFAAQHIDELWQLVDARSPEDVPEARDPPVA